MFEKMQDFKFSEKNLYSQYLTLWNNKDISGITEFFSANPNLKYKVFNAFNWNRLIELVNDATESASATTKSLTGKWNSDYSQLKTALSDFKYMGQWDSSTNYKKNNLVKTDDFHSYYCLADNTNKNPRNDSTNWIVSKKIDGPAGLKIFTGTPGSSYDDKINDGYLWLRKIDHDLFNSTSWEQIGNYCLYGIAQYYFNIGDRKQITLSNGNVVYCRILDFNKDEISTYPHNKANITLGIENPLGEGPMNQTQDPFNSWNKSYMRTKTMNELKSLLPTQLQTIIKNVRKWTEYYRIQSGALGHGLSAYNDDLWLLSYTELTGEPNSKSPDYYEGNQYEFYKNRGASRLSIGENWFLRSPIRPVSSTSISFKIVKSKGLISDIFGSELSTNTASIIVGFCI